MPHCVFSNSAFALFWNGWVILVFFMCAGVEMVCVGLVL